MTVTANRLRFAVVVFTPGAPLGGIYRFCWPYPGSRVGDSGRLDNGADITEAVGRAADLHRTLPKWFAVQTFGPIVVEAGGWCRHWRQRWN